MNNTYYLYAGFVFLLMLLATYIIKNVIIDKKRDEKEQKNREQYKEKEMELFSLYQDLEEMIIGIEKYLEESMLKVKTIQLIRLISWQR